MHKKPLLPRVIPYRRGSGSGFGLYVRHFLNSSLIVYEKKKLLPRAIPHRCGSGTGTRFHDTYITLIFYAQNLIPYRHGSDTGTRLHDTSLTICLIGDFEKNRSYYGRALSARSSVRPSVHKQSSRYLHDILWKCIFGQDKVSNTSMLSF